MATRSGRWSHRRPKRFAYVAGMACAPDAVGLADAVSGVVDPVHQHHRQSTKVGSLRDATLKTETCHGGAFRPRYH